MSFITALQHCALLVTVLLFCNVQPLLAEHNHGHRQHDKFHGFALERRNVSVANNTSNDTVTAVGSVDDAHDIISRFHTAMAAANKIISSSPAPNVASNLNSTALIERQRQAPFLEYKGSVIHNGTRNGTHYAHIRRGPFLSGNNTNNASSFNHESYTVPPEVAEAARILAEANPLPLEDYSLLFGDLGSKLRRYNDTNVMPQRLQHASGLTSYVSPHELATTYQNGSQVAGPLDAAGLQTSTSHYQNGTLLGSRDTTAYWQETIQQRGAAPYAPHGYKVWRNVRDYGAYGDGVHDDTEAIQRAVSDGGRCGASCPSSTVFPATVYFPSGTYLVSSPIIQYYNTEFLGNPLGMPVIRAAASFVGLGVITSDVYTGDKTEWYLNVNNFLRSVRNFIIDIRATPQDAYVCGIHWQVAQASSLENIWLLSTDPTTTPATTQQGIYMENGSGGFMGDLIFSGGNFGAFFGNQQFTVSGLIFSGCRTGLQISWDWGWAMQDMSFTNCGTGIVIVGGAGGPLSDGQGVGSLTLVDVQMENVPLGIETSLYADNSTSLYIQNGGFHNVNTVVKDTSGNVVLYPGSAGNRVDVVSWGFGKVTSPTGETGFVNGADILAPVVDQSLLTPDGSTPHARFFHRRRPAYSTLGASQLMDVKTLGAKGDGSTDDTAVLNHILDVAANISAIVYFPYGVYVITDTLQVPVGTRILGQAWPQIMASGAKFSSMSNPQVAVRVGQVGAVGVVEIQCMLFTVRGATAGAVLMEWNIHESVQGSAGLWDSHFRVGGAAGSNLQASDCPKTANGNNNCLAASLLLHITQKASAYLENVWMWVADHDIEAADQTQISVYAARGILIESQGPTWLWATSAEHATLYQYQLSAANNLVMGLIQTESPYYQPTPKAPAPFTNGLVFPNDPTFADCPASSTTCAMAWAVRIIDSSDIYVLGTGLYTWFSTYSQSCVDSGLNNCQLSSFYVEQSFDVWIYNLVTVGNIQMISPLNGMPVIAANNRNGYASSIVAWLGGANTTTGGRTFPGYQLYTMDSLTNTDFSSTCKTALTASINCEATTRKWTVSSYHGSLENATLQTQVCDSGCGTSLAAWVKGVQTSCAGSTWPGLDMTPPEFLGGYIWYGYNETCQKEASTGRFCNDAISNFSVSTSIDTMPTSELCSECYLGRLQMMQKSTYSLFNVFPWFQTALKMAIAKCSLGAIPTTAQPALMPVPTLPSLCVSGRYYNTGPGNSCDSIALANNVSSASIFYAGQPILTNCTSLPAGLSICMPLKCPIYRLASDDTCFSAAAKAGVHDITLYNPWISSGCDNLHEANTTLGSVICVGPSGGTYNPGKPTNTSTFPGSGSASSNYSSVAVPPPAGVPVASGTDAQRCGEWHVVAAGDVCSSLTIGYSLGLDLLVMMNPSITATQCTGSLVVGTAYCVRPFLQNSPPVSSSSVSTPSTSRTSSSTRPGSTTSTTSTTSSVASTTRTTTTSASSPTATIHCLGGTTANGITGNLLGLCSYGCDFDHCLSGACVCTSSSSVAAAAPTTVAGKHGCPDTNVDPNGSDYQYYIDLCEYVCSRGYCPAGACRYC